jgi:biopolymer transport protein ExbD
MRRAMKFHNERSPEPEINLIPFIDILLVIVIFLMLSTTYSKFTELQLNLPVADAAAQQERPNEVVVTITSQGAYKINGAELPARDVVSLSRALAQTTQSMDNPIVIISADAQASHQSVMSVMEAARRNGLNQLTFSAQSSGKGD